jgi:hypothetical protein
VPGCSTENIEDEMVDMKVIKGLLVLAYQIEKEGYTGQKATFARFPMKQ